MLKITGLNELSKKLDRLANNAKKLNGQHRIPVSELLTPAFVSSYTKFSNAQELFDASGFKVEKEGDFAAIPDDQWDTFIRSISSFPDWKAMMGAAAGEWAKRRLAL